MKTRIVTLVLTSVFALPLNADEIGHGFPYGMAGTSEGSTNETTKENLWELMLDWFTPEDTESENE